MRSLLSSSAVLLLLLGACGQKPEVETPAPDHTPPAAGPPAVKLVVLLIVDQMPSWSFSQDADLTRGGIRRLLDGGVYYPKAHLPYANSFTAPGHAAISTGAPPAVTGILANSWYRRDAGETKSAVEDPSMPAFRLAGDDADGPPPGASSHFLLAEGLGDTLSRASGGKAHAVSIGLKSRASIMLLGKHGDLAVWYDSSQPAMTTSRFYRDEVPPWLAKLEADHPVAGYLDDVWKPMDPTLLEKATGRKDDGPGESTIYGFDPTFPHKLAEGDPPAVALRSTPFGVDIELATAKAAVEGEQLGADDVTDLLAVTISSHDYAGHYWGQRSWERLDLFLRMDKGLGDFFDYLDQKVGEGRWALLFTTDHGATPLVERSRAAGHDAARVDIATLIDTAEKAAAGVLGEGKWVAAFGAATLYMSDSFAKRSDKDRSAALDAVVEAIRALPHIGFAERTDKLIGDCDQRQGIAALACRSLRPERSGEVFIAAARYSILTDKPTAGTTHGSPNPEDTTIPIIVYAPGRKPAVVDEPVSSLRISPTVADLLGVPPPPNATAEPL